MTDVSHIKTELQQLIEKEEDIDILEAIRTLLQKRQLDTVRKEKLSSRAEHAEEDIRQGRMYSRREVEARTNDKIQP